MRARSWIRRAGSALRAARMALRSRGVILLYHRIAAPRTDPLLLCVSPDHFEQHLAVLRKDYHPLSLGELAAAQAAGAVPDRAVAITFDDGYADNATAAAPLLRASGQRATVFIAGNCLEGKPFYYDELEEILLLAPRLPRKIRLTIDGQPLAWELGGWARLPKNVAQNYWLWNVDATTDPTPRQRCYRELFDLLRGASPAVRARALADLRKAAGAGAGSARRMMTRAEIRKAAQTGPLEFGAHTRSHPALNRLSAAAQREEIVRGRQMLEAAAGVPVTAFAYPYGSPWDVSRETVRLARAAGFACACANTPAPVDAESDPYWLPRCLVRDWDGAEFARRLEGFFRPRAEPPPQG
jgi:peptidoglycan/xylan/chitin deacetylase (PgdA/CDA1 family)